VATDSPAARAARASISVHQHVLDPNTPSRAIAMAQCIRIRTRLRAVPVVTVARLTLDVAMDHSLCVQILQSLQHLRDVVRAEL